MGTFCKLLFLELCMFSETSVTARIILYSNLSKKDACVDSIGTNAHLFHLALISYPFGVQLIFLRFQTYHF